ncbi:MAG: site-specific DNA-methyltransferase [Patescibacteria group bacterium]|jgi:DNA modification methylase|nr:site-specific DNA-methyltransferase [Patescibacteria group bacterium]
MSKDIDQQNINVVHNIDSRKLSEIISPDVKVQTTITSPPYFDMKDYGAKNQVGFGQNYEDYLDDLQSIFGDVLERTNDDGTLWIIIDSFKRDNQIVTLPFDLSNKLKEIGWLLQDVLIWKKDKTVPWSKNGFIQRKFEYILFFSKSPKFKTNKDSVRVYDTSQLKKWWVKYPERYNPKGKALDEIWEFPIPTQGSWGDQYVRHFCPLPKEMVATMIVLSTNEGDVVLDPFAGSGTVLSQSANMKRNYIGFELNKDYIKMFEAYLKKSQETNQKEYELFKGNNNQSNFENTILELRSLKYARVLLNNIQKSTGLEKFRIFVETKNTSNVSNKLIKVDFTFFGTYDETINLELISEFINKPPLSKFGIEPNFIFKKALKLNNEKHYGYTTTNSYSYNRQYELNSEKIRVISKICVDLNENDYL